MIVAIDGPAGSGKSSVARAVARSRGLVYLDTGAMYRSVALAALGEGVPLDDAEALTALAERCEVEFANAPDGSQRVLLNGSDVTDAIRTPAVDAAVSSASRVAGVRAVMVGRQRAIAEAAGVVAEGRDTGTVVFPGAGVKVFLTASPEVRAHRRAVQNRLRARNAARAGSPSGKPAASTADPGAPDSAPDEAAVLASIVARDEADSTREVSPLAVAPGAVSIDTSDMSFDEVVARICELVDRAEEEVPR